MSTATVSCNPCRRQRKNQKGPAEWNPFPWKDQIKHASPRHPGTSWEESWSHISYPKHQTSEIFGCLGFHQKRQPFFRRVLAPTWWKLLSSCFSFWSLRSLQLAMSWSVSFVWRMVDGVTRTQINMLRLENKVVATTFVVTYHYQYLTPDLLLVLLCLQKPRVSINRPCVAIGTHISRTGDFIWENNA